jgi:hypothetical protein
MKLPRPYIPLEVRLQVAIRQATLAGLWFHTLPKNRRFNRADKLDIILAYLFGFPPNVNLDHDPSLCNRKFNPRTGKYSPDANDPDYLIYRRAEDHRTKTIVRGEHGQHSDLGLRRKNKRIAANRDPNRRRSKIPNRKAAWPKRSFPKRRQKEMAK